MSKQKFKTVLQKVGSWTIAPATINTRKIFQKNNSIRVKGTINGLAFKDVALMPIKDGNHFLVVNSQMRKAIKKEAGDTVEIVLEKDDSTLEIPEELTQAFEASEEAKKMFEAYSPSHKRNYVRIINSSTKKETREKRAVEAVIALEKIFFEKGLPKKSKNNN